MMLTFCPIIFTDFMLPVSLRLVCAEALFIFIQKNKKKRIHGNNLDEFLIVIFIFTIVFLNNWQCITHTISPNSFEIKNKKSQVY